MLTLLYISRKWIARVFHDVKKRIAEILDQHFFALWLGVVLALVLGGLGTLYKQHQFDRAAFLACQIECGQSLPIPTPGSWLLGEKSYCYCDRRITEPKTSI